MRRLAPEESDASLAAFRELARKLGIFLHVGSLAIKLLPEKAANRSFLIDRKGEIVARYDKIHMFDVDLSGGESYRESRNYRPGEIGVAADLPWGRLGLTVCYDLRFPALYRALAEAGSSFLAIPSAFTRQTGEAHWHVLNRARAIENGAFVLAAAQGRQARKRQGNVRSFACGRPLGPHSGRGRYRAGRGTGGDRSRRGHGGARKGSFASARTAVRSERADGGTGTPPRGARPGMIRYALTCDKGHAFESWFQNSAAYDTQVKRRLVSLPHVRLHQDRKDDHGAAGIGSEKARRSARTTDVNRAAALARPAPEAPAPVAMVSPQEREFRKKLKELRDHLTKNADYVGQKFPEEARKMHYGEIEHRSIFGEASPDQAKELHEEGIEFHPLPVLPDERN